MVEMPWLTIDCHYLFSHFAASFLKNVDGRGIFVENNTARAVPYLIEALNQQKIQPEQVDYLIVTHAHLDHAGGTSELLKQCSKATVLAHPKAARTLMNPTRLIEGAKKVYGEEKFLELYGGVEPIPSNRIRVILDGERIQWQDRFLFFFYTAGHASHHLCVVDEKDKAVFTGDSFGLSYPALKGKGLFHIPSTSPVDFDFKEALQSIDRILNCGAKTAFLTHYGPVTDLSERAKELKRHLEYHQSLIEEVELKKLPDSEVNQFIFDRLRIYFDEELQNSGILRTKTVEEILKLDLELNAAGLSYSCLKNRKKSE